MKDLILVVQLYPILMILVEFQLVLNLLPGQHCLIHCQSTESVLRQAMGKLWYCPRAGWHPSRCSLLSHPLNFFEIPHTP